MITPEIKRQIRAMVAHYVETSEQCAVLEEQCGKLDAELKKHGDAIAAEMKRIGKTVLAVPLGGVEHVFDRTPDGLTHSVATIVD